MVFSLPPSADCCLWSSKFGKGKLGSIGGVLNYISLTAQVHHWCHLFCEWAVKIERRAVDALSLMYQTFLCIHGLQLPELNSCAELLLKISAASHLDAKRLSVFISLDDHQINTESGIRKRWFPLFLSLSGEKGVFLEADLLRFRPQTCGIRWCSVKFILIFCNTFCWCIIFEKGMILIEMFNLCCTNFNPDILNDRKVATKSHSKD